METKLTLVPMEKPGPILCRLRHPGKTGRRRACRDSAVFWLYALALLVALGATRFSVRGALTYPEGDPPIPKLSEPSQTEEPTVYRARREALLKELGEGVAVVFDAGTEDSAGFRPNSDFFYLTGVSEPDAVLVLAPKERTYREFLLLPSRDPEAERWTGERDPIGMALRKKYGFEKILRSGRLTEVVLG